MHFFGVANRKTYSHKAMYSSGSILPSRNQGIGNCRGGDVRSEMWKMDSPTLLQKSEGEKAIGIVCFMTPGHKRSWRFRQVIHFG